VTAFTSSEAKHAEALTMVPTTRQFKGLRRSEEDRRLARLILVTVNATLDWRR